MPQEKSKTGYFGDLIRPPAGRAKRRCPERSFREQRPGGAIAVNRPVLLGAELGAAGLSRAPP
jgi:hypothetical protein